MRYRYLSTARCQDVWQVWNSTYPLEPKRGLGGLGEGKGLVKGLQGHPDLKVVSICDTNPLLARDIATRFNVSHHTTDLGSALVHPEVNIVAIYTPDQLHLAHIRAAFEAGKHVVCTKPLVNSLAEAREVVALAEVYPKQRLMVGQSSRFFGSMQHQRRAFEAGKLGALYFVETSYVHDMRWFYKSRPWTREGAFDLILGGCSHPVDLSRWYLGDVQQVHAFADCSAPGVAVGLTEMTSSS